jgi:hypothetical protein
MKAKPIPAILRYLLAPEDTSAALSSSAPPSLPAVWQLAKTAFWITFGVMAALLIGRL